MEGEGRGELPPALLDHPGYRAHVHHGRKYARVDFDTSGAYMVDQQGNIYGIKAYGVVNRAHHYGTLDTLDDWDWSGYHAVRKEEVAQ